MKIIIYGSKYGNSKQYATELSQKTNIEKKSYKRVKDINQYDTIIFIGSLYAGKTLGLKKTFKKLKNFNDKKIVVATVGLADPTSLENTNKIKNDLKRELGYELYKKAKIFHLRGGIDYPKLNFTHRLMMSMLVKHLKGLPEEKQTDETKQMIETYNKKVDFVNLESLNLIVEFL
ncbi:MAG: flavodoxin domain-containing protein [Acholeplasmataceae bacterium]|jgi:menaquinone-dependent protoporphyrinogen IX oxidase